MITWLRGLIPQPEIRAHLLRDEGEVIVDEVAHHWVAYVRPAGWGVLGVLLLVLGFFVDLSIAWLFLVAAGFVVALRGYPALSVHIGPFLGTNMRGFRHPRVLSPSPATIPPL